jgi:glycosyltransferase involved in cell wall biosynthesis
MNGVFLSVAVITYNQENYIAQTLNSIIEQEHSYSYEIIVGEDCSTDETRKVLLKYKEKYPDIIKLLLNEKNLGAVKNYFNCIDHCTGKYIMGCGGDDYWLPEKVSAQIQYMEEHSEAGMCYGKCEMINDKNNIIKIFPNKMDRQYVNFKNLLLLPNPIPAATTCLRRDLMSEYLNNIDPVQNNWTAEDYPMWLWFAYNSQIHPLNKILAVYRRLDGTISNPKEFVKVEQFVNSCYDIKKFYLELYKMSFLEEEIRILKNDSLTFFAIKYGDYDKYKIYVRKLHMQNVKFFIKKVIGTNRLLFLLYSKFYSVFRGAAIW